MRLKKRCNVSAGQKLQIRKKSSGDKGKNIPHYMAEDDDWTRIQAAIEHAGDKPVQEQDRILIEALKRIYPTITPRTGQLCALRQLVFQRKNLLLIAKTSFGKSMMLQAPSVLRSNAITIVIIPLTAIGEEQVRKVKNLPNAKPVLLTAETKSKRILADIGRGIYTHVFLSPELALSPEFGIVARDPGFNSRVVLIAIDEAHLVEQWGSKFRQTYAQLQLLRTWLGHHIPWYACSATMSRKTIASITARLGFEKEKLSIIRMSINRPEIAIIVHGMKAGTAGKFTSLFFLIDNAVRTGSPSPQDIPKTIVFIDSKKKIRGATAVIRRWLMDLKGYRYEDVMWTVRIYHAHTARPDKVETLETFRTKYSPIRIVIATEALGLGVDLPDVDRVVQYGMPKQPDMAVLWQRFGRAARGEGCVGEAVFIVESWAFGDLPDRLVSGGTSQSTSQHLPRSTLSQSTSIDDDDDDDDAHSNASLGLEQLNDEDIENEAEAMVDEDSPSSDRRKRRGKRTEGEQRARLPRVLWKLLNQDSCYRRSFTDHFENDKAEDIEQERAVTETYCCCNKCCKTLTQATEPPPSHIDTEKPMDLDVIVRHISDWSVKRLETMHPNAAWPYLPDIYMSEALRVKLASRIDTIESLNTLKEVLVEWDRTDELGPELLAVIGHIRHSAKEELQLIVAENNARKSLEKSVASARKKAVMDADVRCAVDEHRKNLQEREDQVRESFLALQRLRTSQIDTTLAPSEHTISDASKELVKTGRKKTSTKRRVLSDITNQVQPSAKRFQPMDQPVNPSWLRVSTRSTKGVNSWRQP